MLPMVGADEALRYTTLRGAGAGVLVVLVGGVGALLVGEVGALLVGEVGGAVSGGTSGS